MDFIVKRIWWITIPIALAVLAFQLYWLRGTYISQQTSFRQLAADALQRAHEQTMMLGMKQAEKNKSKIAKQFGLDDKKEDTSSSTSMSVSMIMDTDIDSPMTVNRSIQKMNNMISGPAKPKSPSRQEKKDDADVGSIKDTSRVSIYTTTQTLSGKDSSISKHHDGSSKAIKEIANRFVANMFAYGNLVDTDTALLRKNFLKELADKQINLPFQLHLYKKDTLLPSRPETISIKIVTMDSGRTLAATFDGLSKMLLLKILWPIVLSFLLVLLIASCIWILGRIIQRQKKLEVMKNDFISNITHELKTPVAILSATNEALLTFGGMHDTEKTARYLRLSQDEIHKLQGLVDNIMALTRMEHGEDIPEPVEDVNIPALIKSVTARYTGLPGVHIHPDIQLQHENLRTRPAAVRTILSNLLDNAIKYTTATEKHIYIKVCEQDQHYTVIVQDNGIGIDRAYLPYIFDKFYRVPQGNVHEVKGYGLGLSHVKSLLQRLGGTIKAESRLGQGTTFTVQLKHS